MRNSALDARNFFDTVKKPGADSAAPPSFRKNQFGGSLGGPLKKDKIFFFINYEGIRQALGQSRVATVPGPNSRTPIATNANGTPTAAANPSVAAAIRNTLALYPQPTTLLGNGAVGLVTTVASQVANENYYLGRFDFNATEKDAFFVRYVFDKQDLLDPYTGGGQLLPFWTERDIMNNTFLMTQWRRIISPSVVNTARASYSRLDTSLAISAPTNAALQFFPGAGRPDGIVNISGVTSLGTVLFAPSLQVGNRFTEGDDLLWTHGAHSTRFGGSISRQQWNLYYPLRGMGVWVFNSLDLFRQGVAQSFLGTPVGPQYYPNRDWRETQITAYVQHDWKATSRLTVNLGLRYSFVTNPTEANDAIYAITDYANSTDFVHVPHPSKVNPNRLNLDPRVGFAYDVFGDHKTALRGGFAINHSPVFVGNFANGTVKPWDSVQELNPRYPTPYTNSGVNAALPSSNPGWDYFNSKAPYLMQFNLNLQREIANGTVVSAGYVGSRGISLFTGREMNPFLATISPAGVYTFSNTRRNPKLGTLVLGEEGSTSTYHSAQFTVNRRMSRNVQAQLAYTYASCIDDGGSPLASLSGANTPSNWSNPYDRSIDRGRCYFTARHALRLNGLVTLPFRGNRFVEGWQLSGILSNTSGLPLTLQTGFDRAFIGGQGRPNYVGNCEVAVGTVNRWFNPSCFTLQAAGTTGNLGRNTVIGPGLVNVDLSISKNTKILEGLDVQFRGEVFNIANHANFAQPASALFTASGINPLAGQITQTVTTARQIQFGLKFIF